MKPTLADIYHFEDLEKKSLREVESLYRQGYISQDLYEAYYHLWRRNPKLMGNHMPCQCGICRKSRLDSIPVERVPLWHDRSYQNQRHYWKIDEDWGFFETTIFHGPFDPRPPFCRFYVWKGPFDITHPNGTVEQNPYTGEHDTLSFKNHLSALEFCLQVKEFYDEFHTKETV